MSADSREKILRRIREALTVPAAAPHHDAAHKGADSHSVQDWLPPVPPDRAGMVSLFEKNSADLKTNVVRCASRAALADSLAALARDGRWRSVASHDFELGTPAVGALRLPVLRTDEPYNTLSLEACDAGISGCLCLVAQTGGILVSAATAGGRALSVLPPHHVVIARESQIVRDLGEAFQAARAKDGSVPAFLSFITGPSRTGDIERILVLGAHGPKILTVLLLAD